jgi:hypothetical protein
MGLTEENLSGVGGFGRIRVKEGHQIVIGDILDERAAVADEGDTEDNSKERKPSADRSVGRDEDRVVEEGTELI